ncbi:low temperature requirement protein A [Inquilinus limosus]|uniref:Membrane protein n=1 Tax=Inquilinus limosus MP06 TaxID=1398085 RepID=A0A0A0D592_9PROT|nr:low temperature requirement protein A [Inquilinus limosus]KGM33264.1 membrane protein [Inquilinus limosus MP06]
MTTQAARGLLRPRKAHEHGKVTFVELFFDLVFVFAITQLSHGLLHDLTLLGAVHTALLFLAVWWVWIYTSWVTNWLDPERTPVRLLLLVLMLAGLVLSTSLPEAFAEKGLAFAGAYVFMQLGRSLFTAAALRGHSPGNYRNFLRISAWLAVSAVLWIAGALVEAEARLALWTAALAIEYVSPSLGFWTPGLGRSTTADWDVEGGHMAERCGLFVIIALGESILVTGATFAELEPDGATVTAFVISFIGSVAMWWIYFDIGAERGSHRIAHAEDPGRLARIAYTYIHLLIVAGIIVGAVADELVLAHPTGHVGVGTVAALLGGPALYLLGNALFKWTTTGRIPLSHLAGLVLLALLIPLSDGLSPLLLSAGVAVVMLVVAVWERLSLRGAHALSSPEIG